VKPRPDKTAAPIAVDLPTAAAMLDMSLSSFCRHVRPGLKLVRSGRLVRVAVAELQRWVDANSDYTLPGSRG
jgi:hypothetical protein